MLKTSTKAHALLLCFLLIFYQAVPAFASGEPGNTVVLEPDKDAFLSSESEIVIQPSDQAAFLEPDRAVQTEGEILTAGEEPETGEDAVDMTEAGAYREWFVDQHLNYIDSAEYQESVISVMGSEAGLIAEAFDGAMMQGWNSLWQKTSFVMNVIGGDDISFDDPIQMVVADAMAATVVKGGYSEEYSKSVYNALDGLLRMLSTIMNAPITETGLDLAVNGTVSSFQDVSGILEGLRMELYAISKTGDVSDLSLLMQKSNSILNRLDTLFEEAFENVKVPEKMAEKIQRYCKLGMGAADIVNCSFHEFFRAWILYEAYQSTTDTWVEFWERVMGEAAVESGPGRVSILSGTGSIADEIEKNLKDVKAAKADSGQFGFALKHAAKEGFSSGIEDGIEFAVFMFHESLPPGNKIRAIMDMTSITHSVINYLTNMDDMAFYGQMAFGSGELARCAGFALALAEAELRNEASYEAACRFDETFHYYRELQLSTIDYTIAYDRQITDAALYPVIDKIMSINHKAGVWIWSVPEEERFTKETEIETLSSVRGKWAVRDCHVNAQLELIAANRQLWDPEQREDTYYVSGYSMAVTDMNGNGRLEVITSWTMGSGSFTDYIMYEVNENVNEMNEVTISDDFAPDIHWIEAAEVYRDGDSVWILFPDYLRNGINQHIQSTIALKLKNGSFETKLLGYNQSDLIPDTSEYEETYYDGTGFPISKSSYKRIGDLTFPDQEKGKMIFRWVNSSDMKDDMSGKGLIAWLQESWAGFGCDLF